MAAGQGTNRGRGRRPELVKNARRGGPPRAFWIALGLIAVIGLGALAWSAARPKSRVTQLDPSLPALKAEGYVLGSPAAPVEVVEFADFECPACGQFATITEPDVRTRLVNTGQIRVRFIDYPLPMHRNTWDASLAAACANDQGKFWEMHDALFANQDRWNGEATSRPRGVIADLAKGLGLDMAKYGSCMDNETHRAKIQSHQAEAERRQVNSTPTFVFNGTVVPSALPYDAFKKHVDEATAAAASAPKSAAPAGAPVGTAPGVAPVGARP
ncbi:MAG: putative oxidoreductase [Gemmatimonadetes bacterium]|nr:putative oxidoreductase [Gemmatimonadota bacterium]